MSFLCLFLDLVGFWKGKESVEGLSIRMVLFNAFASTVIFLYLADFSASPMILLTSAAAAAIDLWKVCPHHLPTAHQYVSSLLVATAHPIFKFNCFLFTPEVWGLVELGD